MALLGSGTQADPYLLSTIDDLRQVSSGTSTQWNYYKMTDDIDLSSASDSSPIITGQTVRFEIDGDGHKFTNLRLHERNFGSTSYQYWGIFERTYHTTFKNIGIEGFNFTTYDRTGAFTGQAGGDTLFENCYVANSFIRAYAPDGNSSYWRYIGGFVGYGLSPIIFNNCFVSGVARDDLSFGSRTVAGTREVGGFVGYGNGHTFNNCYFIGSVYAGSTTTEGAFTPTNFAPTLNNCYVVTNSVTSAQGATEYPSGEYLQDESNFGGFDFDNDWIINPSQNYGMPIPKIFFVLGEKIQETLVNSHSKIVESNIARKLNPNLLVAFTQAISSKLRKGYKASRESFMDKIMAYADGKGGTYRRIASYVSQLKSDLNRDKVVLYKSPTTFSKSIVGKINKKSKGLKESSISFVKDMSSRSLIGVKKALNGYTEKITAGVRRAKQIKFVDIESYGRKIVGKVNHSVKYPIRTEADFQMIRDNPHMNFKIMNDIEFTETYPNYVLNIDYYGELDGNGKTITGIKLPASTSDKSFIRAIYGKVHRLSLNYDAIEGTGTGGVGNISLICGHLYGEISEISAISANTSTESGSISGMVYRFYNGATMKNCYTETNMLVRQHHMYGSNNNYYMFGRFSSWNISDATIRNNFTFVTYDLRLDNINPFIQAFLPDGGYLTGTRNSFAGNLYYVYPYTHSRPSTDKVAGAMWLKSSSDYLNPNHEGYETFDKEKVWHLGDGKPKLRVFEKFIQKLEVIVQSFSRITLSTHTRWIKGFKDLLTFGNRFFSDVNVLDKIKTSTPVSYAISMKSNTSINMKKIIDNIKSYINKMSSNTRIKTLKETLSYIKDIETSANIIRYMFKNVKTYSSNFASKISKLASTNVKSHSRNIVSNIFIRTISKMVHNVKSYSKRFVSNTNVFKRVVNNVSAYMSSMSSNLILNLKTNVLSHSKRLKSIVLKNVNIVRNAKSFSKRVYGLIGKMNAIKELRSHSRVIFVDIAILRSRIRDVLSYVKGIKTDVGTKRGRVATSIAYVRNITSMTIKGVLANSKSFIKNLKSNIDKKKIFNQSVKSYSDKVVSNIGKTLTKIVVKVSHVKALIGEAWRAGSKARIINSHTGKITSSVKAWFEFLSVIINYLTHKTFSKLRQRRSKIAKYKHKSVVEQKGKRADTQFATSKTEVRKTDGGGD